MRAIRLLQAFAALSLASAAPAATVTFTGISSGEFSGSATEAGFTYSEASGALYGNVFGNPGGDLEGYGAGGGGVARFVEQFGADFTFTGLDYAAFADNNTGSQSLLVQGYLNGLLVGSDSFLLANTSTFSPTYPNWTTFAASGLAGVTIDELLVTLNGAGSPVYQYQAIDNVVFGAAAVPEPATWAMMLLGFGAVGFALRRGRAAAPAIA